MTSINKEIKRLKKYRVIDYRSQLEPCLLDDFIVRLGNMIDDLKTNTDNWVRNRSVMQIEFYIEKIDDEWELIKE